MKDTLNGLISERAVADSKGTLGLICTVLLKYGTAPLVCAYFMWVMVQKDIVIQKSNEVTTSLSQKNNDTLVTIVREQTTATAQNTIALQGLNTVLQVYNNKLTQMEDDRKEERRNAR